MNELRELYREVILDHNSKPRNFGPLPGATGIADGYNPMCGDKVEVSVIVDGPVLKDVHFEGCGCAISQASASLMTEATKGKSVQDAKDLYVAFHQMVTSEEAVSLIDEMDPLSALAGVREFPVRVKCATLAWHALLSAIEKSGETVTTE
jgi:nitrogen fixation NifU-like protein